MKRITLLAFLAGLSSSVAASAQGGGQGVNREAMWPAPTADDWKKPCLVTWQRTWEDAVAVSRETKRPILICVNMDGEIASEHYAGVRYRQPDIAALYEPYVCVIASVYRHAPRDSDEHGERVVCPRFGTVTCGEHIAIEPGLYEKYFDGQRVAPRHIAIELDGAETYDVYYAWDTDSVFAAIRKGIADRPPIPPVVRGDRTIYERVASPDVKDRLAVEAAYRGGDRSMRRALLEAAVAAGEKAPVEMLRLAVSGMDTEMAGLARQALAKAGGESAADLINEALRVPMGAPEREALLAALRRIGETSPRARTMSVVHQGLASRSDVVDVEKWSKALENGPARSPAVEAYEAAARLEAQTDVFRSGDAEAHAALAESFLASALGRMTEEGTSSLRSQSQLTDALLLDARATAKKAETLGAGGWRVNSVLAVANFYLGDVAEAHRRAEAAMAHLPPDATSWNSMVVLGLFAEMRQDAIQRAIRTRGDWPGQWLTDVHAARAVLSRHPHASDDQIASYYDFLKWLGAAGQAAGVLDAGLLRFPESPVLHNRYRACILDDRGADGLETAYEERLKGPDVPKTTAWFAGYASYLAAEHHRRAQKTDRARAAYDRAIALFEKSIGVIPESRDTSDHHIVLCLGGRARLSLEARGFDAAMTDLLAAFARRPDAAATLDGLNISPVDTAKMLRSRAGEAGRTDVVTRIDEALGKLDPKLLELPAYERGGPPPESRPGSRPGRRRRDG